MNDKDKQIRQVIKEEKARGQRSTPKNTLRARQDQLKFLLDYGSEEDYIALLKNWDIPVTEELINEFRRLRKEKRRLLR